MNSAIEDGEVQNLGIVVLDEVHMVDDEHRGYLLELLATKLLTLEQDIQIVGMSATLSVSRVIMYHSVEWKYFYRPRDLHYA